MNLSSESHTKIFIDSAFIQSELQSLNYCIIINYSIQSLKSLTSVCELLPVTKGAVLDQCGGTTYLLTTHRTQYQHVTSHDPQSNLWSTNNLTINIKKYNYFIYFFHILSQVAYLSGRSIAIQIANNIHENNLSMDGGSISK